MSNLPAQVPGCLGGRQGRAPGHPSTALILATSITHPPPRPQGGSGQEKAGIEGHENTPEAPTHLVGGIHGAHVGVVVPTVRPEEGGGHQGRSIVIEPQEIQRALQVRLLFLRERRQAIPALAAREKSTERASKGRNRVNKGMGEESKHCQANTDMAGRRRVQTFPSSVLPSSLSLPFPPISSLPSCAFPPGSRPGRPGRRTSPSRKSATALPPPCPKCCRNNTVRRMIEKGRGRKGGKKIE